MQKISKIIFIKYKAFEKYAVSLRNINILVGPNNCGKSTIIGALRLLEVGIKRAQVKSPTIIDRHEGRAGWGYKLNEETSPISIENVHFNYADEPALVEFQLSDGAKLFLYFPVDGGAYFYGESLGSRVTSPTSFRKSFPLSIVSIPILGPVEHNEDLVSLETVRTNISSHRASRNFRSYWHYNKVDFSEFRELIRSTWKGMDVLPPSYSGGNVIMMCKDGRIERELYWSGYGFQIWCQMMSHLARANNASHIIIDEPEVYLHPDVQRKLFALLNKYESHVVIATHSTELLSEADIEDIVLIDKLKPRGTRLKDEDGVQLAMETLGSTHCISLMRMAKSRKILFVEAIEDFKILCKFGKKMQLDLANSQDQFVVRESDGFGNWTNIKAFSWGFN